MIQEKRDRSVYNEIHEILSVNVTNAMKFVNTNE